MFLKEDIDAIDFAVKVMKIHRDQQIEDEVFAETLTESTESRSKTSQYELWAMVSTKT